MSYIHILRKAIFKKHSLPAYLIFFVTHRCNASCNHCFYWPRINSHVRELALGQIDTITKSLGCLLHVNFTGGEPFLRNDLPEIASIFYRNCKVRSFGISTNGYAPDKIANVVARILRECPGASLEVDVSLDHFNSTHDRMRSSEGLFNNALRTIANLRAISSRHLITGINLLLMHSNEADIKEIYAFLRDKVHPDVIFPILARGSPRDSGEKNVSPRSYEKLVSLWLEDLKNGTFILSRNKFLNAVLIAKETIAKGAILNRITGKGRYRRCLGGTTAAVMREDGEVFPCELLCASFGKLSDNEYVFKNLWFSRKADTIRAEILKTGCSCTHECFQNVNALFDFTNYPRLAGASLPVFFRKKAAFN